jgi:hypothetical protein
MAVPFEWPLCTRSAAITRWGRPVDELVGCVKRTDPLATAGIGALHALDADYTDLGGPPVGGPGFFCRASVL